MENNTIVNSTESPSTGVSLQDLSLLVQIVDLASSRGAFRGPELTQVGAVYDRVSGFLKYVAEQQEAAAETSNDQVEEGPVGPEGV